MGGQTPDRGQTPYSARLNRPRRTRRTQPQREWWAGWARLALVIDELRAAAEALGEGDPAPLAALFAEDAEWRGISHGHLWWKHTPS